ncbi:hypothetical protein RchiOBHm_Chr6g0246761 [Rosa chinensis]|uniref:Uncharacterized protein n=1 Tax=Rosa chinensis TaxID=74649 RepID=A0A2P6PJM5_ROSCH|nr:hypothetical protein RchiOBHm_Chr6g0246761 [Rosa chinensis]
MGKGPWNNSLAVNGKKKAGGARLWMRLDCCRRSELEVLPFPDQLRQQLLSHKTQSGQWLPVLEVVEGLQCDLPFEFQVLEIALEHKTQSGQWLPVSEVVEGLQCDLPFEFQTLRWKLTMCSMNWPEMLPPRILNLFTCSLKSTLTRLLARVQQVRDEIEHLLDDNEDMAHLYLTRKWIQNQQSEALLARSGSNSISPLPQSSLAKF